MWQFEVKWRDGNPYTCAAITKWSSYISDSSARRVGLVLMKIDLEDPEARSNPYVVSRRQQAQDTYVRVGIFLGPYLDDDEIGWVEETFVVI